MVNQATLTQEEHDSVQWELESRRLDLRSLLVRDLRGILRDYFQSTAGDKETLVSRIVEYERGKKLREARYNKQDQYWVKLLGEDHERIRRVAKKIDSLMIAGRADEAQMRGYMVKGDLLELVGSYANANFERVFAGRLAQNVLMNAMSMRYNEEGQRVPMGMLALDKMVEEVQDNLMRDYYTSNSTDPFSRAVGDAKRRGAGAWLRAMTSVY